MRALLAVSFGTSYEDTREKTIDAVEADLRAEFPDLAFYSAWTSGRIIAKVAEERGEHHDTLEEAFAKMSADGVDDLVISTMFLMKGGEMAKVMRAAEEWMAAGERAAYVADPLLATARDRRRVAEALCEEFINVAEDEAVLFMGHGVQPNAAPRKNVNDVYARIQDEFHALERTQFFVATVEGEPTFDDALPLVQACNPKCVFLSPLMIVSGDHANNDLAGEDENSWASRLQACGLRTQAVLRGLGEYEGIRKLVCTHVHEALMVREVALRG